MKLEAESAFGRLYSDARVPKGEIWVYGQKNQEPGEDGHLPEPDAKIANIGHDPGKLWWVTAPR